MKIGQWVRRVSLAPSGRVLTRWHLVDSVVAGEAFTNCGRRFRRNARSEFETTDSLPMSRMNEQPRQLCQDCQ